MDSQDVSLFRLASEAQIGDILAPFEYVTSVTACAASTLYALTSNGRILTLNEEFRVNGEAKLPPQKKVTGEACIDYIDITGILAVLFNNTLYFFQIEDQRAQLLYSKSDVVRFAFSSTGTQQHFPDHDLVYVTTRNQVVRLLLSLGEQSRERVGWKWRADSPVSAVAFDGSCVCLTTNTGCYVHPVDSSASPSEPILAFPIDRAVLPLNCPPPSICHVDEDTFIVAGCMPSMALFVDGSGSAARPPLVWSAEHPRKIVKTESTLVVVGEQKLIVFDNSPSGRMQQELPIPFSPCAAAAVGDSVVVFTRSPEADVYCIRQSSWSQKANEFLERGHIDNALYLVCNNSIKNEDDEIAYREVHTRAGFNKIANGDVDRGIEFVVEGRVTPFEVKKHFSAVFDSVDSPEDKISDVIIVEKLIGRLIDEDWAEPQIEDWATLLIIARLRLVEEPSEIIEILEASDHYDKHAVQEYCETRKLPNCLLVLHTLTSSLPSALSLEWLDPALLPLIDRSLLVTLLFKLDASDVSLIYKWRPFVVEEERAEQELLDGVRRRLEWFTDEFILDLFRERSEELEIIMELYAANSAKSETNLKRRLVELATGRLRTGDMSADESGRLRRTLIEIILDGWNDAEMLEGDRLTIERVVAENSTDPEAAIHAIIEHVEAEGALQAIQQIIHHFSATHSSLSTHFLQQLKRKCESDPSASSALRLPQVMRTVIEASPAIIESGSIKFIPQNSPLDLFAPLIYRELQHVNNRSVASKMARSLAERISSKKEDPLSKTAVKVTESSRCGVCSGRFDNSSSIHFLPSGRLVHPSCHPHINICPVTNQVFRG